MRFDDRNQSYLRLLEADSLPSETRSMGQKARSFSTTIKSKEEKMENTVRTRDPQSLVWGEEARSWLGVGRLRIGGLGYPAAGALQDSCRTEFRFVEVARGQPARQRALGPANLYFNECEGKVCRCHGSGREVCWLSWSTGASALQGKSVGMAVSTQ